MDWAGSIYIDNSIMREIQIGSTIALCCKLGFIPGDKDMRELTEDEYDDNRNPEKNKEAEQSLINAGLGVGVFQLLTKGKMYTLTDERKSQYWQPANHRLIITEFDLYYLKCARIKLRSLIKNQDPENAPRVSDMDDDELLRLGRRFVPELFFKSWE
ncbi:hypothetical protein FACS1894184_19380 [Clostridia bacterium]|nr:hypothetical protein FACS1894184_19380 [Clostridia bacterium]